MCFLTGAISSRFEQQFWEKNKISFLKFAYGFPKMAE